jgi:hypothetical protein
MNRSRRLELDTDSHTSRRATSAAPMLGLEHWRSDPVARRFMVHRPAEQVALRHKRFTEAVLYRTPYGGAIILQTADRLVLAMDYCDLDDLEYHWRETLRHYAGVL